MVAKKKTKQPKIQYAEFDSKCLDSAVFEPKNKTITVTFAKDGTSYTYDCSKRTWNDLLDAASAGQFFNEEIKDY